MKKLQAYLTAAVIGCVGVSTGAAQAGNYRPTNVRPGSNSEAVQLERSSDRTDSVNKRTAQGPQPLAGTKTAFFYDSCYTVPVCGGPVCTPIVRCGSPCTSRPYFPASPIYSTPAYGNYGGFGNGGYLDYGIGGYGNYGAGGFGPGGYGLGGFNGGYGVGYGGVGYSNPGYAAPFNPGYGVPYSPQGIGNPYVNPVGNGLAAPGYYPNSYNAGYAPNISPVSQPFYGNAGYANPVLTQPVISAPVYSDPIYSNPVINSPFYP